MAGRWTGRKRCKGCGRFLAERQVAGYDLTRRWYWCDPCALAEDARRFPEPDK